MPYLDVNGDLPFQSSSSTSRDAALKAAAFVGRQGLDVLAYFQGRGVAGGTQKECAEALGIGRPSIAARTHALEKQGRLVKTSKRLDGCAVYIFLA